MKALLSALRKADHTVLSNGEYKGWHIANLVFLPQYRDYVSSNHHAILRIYQDWIFKWRFKLYTEETRSDKKLFNLACDQYLLHLAHKHIRTMTTKILVGQHNKILCKMVWNKEQRSYLELMLQFITDPELHYDIELCLILHKICCTCRKNISLLSNEKKR